MQRVKRYLFFPIHVLKILRAMFTLWLLDRLTYPEIIPLTVYGGYVSHKGEIAIINYPDTDKCELGKVKEQRGNTVYIRLYRRPRA